MRSALCAACESETPRVIAPASIPAAMEAAELTPTISPSNPALRSARAKEPPINPTPAIAILFIASCALCCAPDRGRHCADLFHHLCKLIGTKRLSAVAQRVVGVVMHFYQQPVRSGGNCG